MAPKNNKGGSATQGGKGSGPTSGNKAGGGKGTSKGEKKKQHFEQKKQEYAEQSKKEREANQEAYKRAQDREKYEYYRKRAEEKKREAPPLECGVTYVQDKLGKPKAVPDLSDHWVKGNYREIQLLSFVPTDFYVPGDEISGEARVRELEYFFAEQARMLRKLRELPFHQVWSHVLYNNTVLPALRSFVAFCTRQHEQQLSLLTNDSSCTSVAAASPSSKTSSKNPLSCKVVSHVQGGSKKDATQAPFGAVTSQGLDEARAQCYEHVFWVLVRLTRRSESASERIGEEKYADLMQKVWSFPFLLDFCAVYGGSNFSVVFQGVRSVLQDPAHVSSATSTTTTKALIEKKYATSKKAFAELLEKSLERAYNEEQDDAWYFLADCLVQLECVFAFFPEDFDLFDEEVVIKPQVASSTASSSSSSSSKWLKTALKTTTTSAGASGSQAAKAATSSSENKVLKVYLDLFDKASEREDLAFVRQRTQKVILRYCQSRCPLRGGVPAFDQLEKWIGEFADNHDDLLTTEWALVLEEWHGEPGVDLDRVQCLEQLCGIKTERAIGPLDATDMFATEVDEPLREKIGELREILGSDFGEGFLCALLNQYERNTAQCIDAVFQDQLPVALAVLDRKMTLEEMKNRAASTREKSKRPLDAQLEKALSAASEHTRQRYGQNPATGATLADRQAAENKQRILELVAQQDQQDALEVAQELQKRAEDLHRREQVRLTRQRKALREYDDEPEVTEHWYLPDTGAGQTAGDQDEGGNSNENSKGRKANKAGAAAGGSSKGSSASSRNNNTTATKNNNSSYDYDPKSRNNVKTTGKTNAGAAASSSSSSSRGQHNKQEQQSTSYDDDWYSGYNAQKANYDWHEWKNYMEENEEHAEMDAMGNYKTSKAGDKTNWYGGKWKDWNYEKNTWYDDDEDDEEEDINDAEPNTESEDVTDTGGSKGKGGGKSGKKGENNSSDQAKRTVQGQSYGARRKEANKAKTVNHRRRDRFAQKMSRGFL
ncbi:unnamed protein product [Amoebophrya sp. A120]|nr:unnamed protein product [Amoebophrya sp. A120]|eukprot:GSA120T00002022001.1